MSKRGFWESLSQIHHSLRKSQVSSRELCDFPMHSQQPPTVPAPPSSYILLLPHLAGHTQLGLCPALGLGEQRPPPQLPAPPLAGKASQDGSMPRSGNSTCSLITHRHVSESSRCLG